MQPKQNTPIPGKDENALENTEPHDNEESILEEQDIERDHTNLGSKSLDTRSRARDGLSEHTPQARLFGSELSSFLREVRFSDQEFAAGTLVFNIKYNHFGFQNNNSFYCFHD